MPYSPAPLLKSDRERLREEHSAGASGLLISRELSDSVDRAVLETWESLDGASGSGASLVAVGSYGRKELSPQSDIDLLVLHPKPTQIAAQAKALFYALWDSGLESAPSVLTPKELLRNASQRVEVETSLINARLVCGNPGPLDDLKGGDKKLGPNSKGFTERLATAVKAWRAAGGDAGADLEPDIKEGRGGLRDLTALRWLGLDDPILEDATDLLLRIRNQLHFSTQRRSDRLSMQTHLEVAKALNLPAPEGFDSLPPEEELLRAVYGVCRDTSRRLNEALFDGSRFRDQTRAFAKAADLDGTDPWPPAMRASFLELLRSAGEFTQPLEMIADELLPKVLPEWRKVTRLPQRNIYHRFAVDIHSIEAVATAASLESSEEPLTRRVATDTKPDQDTLLLATLFHDIGKASQGDHSTEGVALTESALKRMGIPGSTIDDVVWLVRNHLLLTKTATRRDLGDERLVLETAERIGSERRLRLLYLLSVADGVATGPAAWGAWRSGLVAHLFTLLDHVLETGELVGRDASKLARSREAEVVAGLAGYPSDQIRTHIVKMPRAWLLGQPVEALVEQSKMLLHAPKHDEVRLVANQQEGTDIWEVMVAAKDRPGLFSKISGSLALHGLNVLSAHIYTREDDVALEVFRVQALSDEKRRFEKVAEDARKAVSGRLSLDARLAEKRKEHSKRLRKGKDEEPSVVIDNSSSDFFSIIEVHTSDRVGLLYMITRALADLELDIHLAKVSTYAQDVVDVFYLRDSTGQKITDPDHLKEIERAILHQISDQ